MSDEIEQRGSVSADIGHALRGVCMGLADVVPGVSGGTVALVLGIYGRLVSAISHFDVEWLGHLRAGRLVSAARHVDLRFLLALVFGVGVGLVGMTVVINRLLGAEPARQFTLATFFGLILGSSILVAQLVRARSRSELGLAIVLGILGALGAAALTQLTPSATDPGRAYLFVCGAIAICAMILPGISGAMILLLLGVYLHLTDIPRSLLHGEVVTGDLLDLGSFAVGAMLGLLAFSRVLKWLLREHEPVTMGALAGLMIGSLPKLWPFQRDLTPEVEKVKHKLFEPVWPEVSGQLALTAGVVVAAAIFVLVVERFAGGRARVTEMASATSA